MPRCIDCGKHSLFLALSPDGRCNSCQVAYESRIQKERRAAFIQRKKDEFASELASIPCVSGPFTGPKIEKRSIADIADLKYSRITAQTKRQSAANFVVVDTETTGVRAASAIIEVSAIKFSDFKPVEILSTLIKPARPIPQEATRINKITNEMVSNAPRIWDIMPALNTFVSGLPLVGHNLSFDLGYLYRDGLDLLPKQKFYDTLSIARHTLKGRKGDEDFDYDVYDYKLDTLCEYYGILFSGAHRASADALATGKLFYELVDARTSL